MNTNFFRYNQLKQSIKTANLQSLTYPFDISQTNKVRKLQLRSKYKRIEILFPDLKKFLSFQRGRTVG